MAGVKMLIQVTIIFSSFTLISTQMSNCKVEEYKVQKNFDPAKFAGTWYAMKYLPNAIYPDPLNWQDLSLTLLPNDDGNFSVYTTLRLREVVGDCFMIKGTLQMPNINTNISAKMEFQQDLQISVTYPFWVMETDYTSYAVVYWCGGTINETTGFCEDANVTGWGLVRQIWDPITPYIASKIDHRLNYFCSNLSLYKPVIHSKEKCKFRKPMFWTPQPDFNLTRYMGRWYEQLFVPTNPFPREAATLYYQHNYALNADGTIHFRLSGRDPQTPGRCFNSSGATIETTDRPGKLKFIRNGTSVKTDYVVVYTDYDAFAFVIGCVEPSMDGSLCKRYHSWVWTRSRYMTGHQALWAKRLMDLYDLDDTKFYITLQNQTCTWEPPPPKQCANGGSMNILGNVIFMITILMVFNLRLE